MCPVAADGLSGSWKPKPEAEGDGGGAASSQGSAGGERCTLPPGRMLHRLPPEENLQGGRTELPGTRRDPGNDAHRQGSGRGPRAAVGPRGTGHQVKTSPLDWAAQTTTPVFIHPTTQRIRLGHRQSLTFLIFDPSVFLMLTLIIVLAILLEEDIEVKIENWPIIGRGTQQYVFFFLIMKHSSFPPPVSFVALKLLTVI